MATKTRGGTTNTTAVRQLRILAANARRLPEIIAQAKLLPPQIFVSDVVAEISPKVSLSALDVSAIFNALEQIRSISKRLGSIDKAIERIVEIFGEENLPEFLENRKQIGQALSTYDEDNTIAISTKAQRITFMRENMYASGEIITDARPIYNSAGDKILEYAITHSLVVTYRRDGDTSTAHYTLDASDIIEIQRACERAIIKARTLKNELGEKARILAEDA